MDKRKHPGGTENAQGRLKTHLRGGTPRYRQKDSLDGQFNNIAKLSPAQSNLNSVDPQGKYWEGNFNMVIGRTS